MTVEEIPQLDLFVKDESTDTQCLRQEFSKKPQTFKDLDPEFMKGGGGLGKHEKWLELSDLLDRNFHSYYGKGEVSIQIYGLLWTDFEDLR